MMSQTNTAATATLLQRWLASSTLNDLLSAWNELRNVVLGRGVSKPANVPQELYDYVGREYLDFRKWLYEAPALNVILMDYFGGGEQLDRYRMVALRARQAGLKFRWPSEIMPGVPVDTMPGPDTLRVMLEQRYEQDPTAPIADHTPPEHIPLLPRAVNEAAKKVAENLPGAVDLAKAFIVGLIAALAIRGLMGRK